MWLSTCMCSSFRRTPTDRTIHVCMPRKTMSTLALWAIVLAHIVNYATLTACAELSASVSSSRLREEDHLPRIANVSHVRIVVEHRERDTYAYDVRVVSVRFKGPYDVLVFGKDNVQGEGSVGLGGTARLVCDKDVYESHQSSPRLSTARHVALDTMVPIENAYIHPATALASVYCHDLGFCGGQGNDSLVAEFLVVTRYRETTNGRAEWTSTAGNSDGSLDGCEVRFLPPQKQTIFAPRCIAPRSGRRKRRCVDGSVRLKRHDPSWADVNDVDISRTRSTTMNATLVNVTSHFDEVTVRKASRGRCVRMSPLVADDTSNGRNDSKIQRDNAYFDKFVELSAGAHASTAFSFVIDPIKKVLPIDLFTNVVGGLVANGVLNNHVEHTTADTSQAVLKMEITNLVVQGLTSRVRESLISSLTETIYESASESITLDMRRRVSSSLTASLSRVLTESIDRDVAERLPLIVDNVAPDRLTRVLLSNVAPLITKSLSHAIVPSLVQTITHSPLQDYYCYFCYHHGAYCTYCHYAPVQLFYAQYYAEYFSSYYGNYYASSAYRESAQDAMSRDKKPLR